MRVGTRARVQVCADHLVGGAHHAHAPFVEQDGSVTEPQHGFHVVAHEEQRASLARYLLHLSKTLLLEGTVANSQHFVDHEYLWFQVRRHGEGQPHVHAAAVTLHRGIQEFLHLREGHDLVELGVDLRAAHAQDRAVEVDVLAAAQFGVETGAHLEQAGHAAVQRYPAFGGLRDTAEDLEQGALASAISTDDAHAVAGVHLEGHIAQREELLRGRTWFRGSSEQRACLVGQHIAQGHIAFRFLVAERVALAQLLDADDGLLHVHQITSAKERSVERK